MSDYIQEILIDSGALKERVNRLGIQISADYAGKDVFMVGILKGAAIFMADLVRSMDVSLTMDFMAISSYGAGTRTSGVVRILKDLDEPIQGRHVMIVEDIVDTGLTLNYLVENLKARHPASLKICCLLDKPSRRELPIKPDYIGFEIPDKFVVGYGLDYSERYRNLPFIAVLKPEVYGG